METSQLIPLFQWLGAGVGGLLALFGVGKLLEIYVRHRIKRRDDRDTLHQSNQGKVIDQDQNAFNSMERRLDKLTERFDKLQEDYSSLMAQNAGLEKENEFLKRDNERLQREVEYIRKESLERGGRIKQLEQQIEDLTKRFENIGR